MENDNEHLTARKLEEQKSIHAFREEANERMTEIETTILELENSPKDPELINAVFRTMHTIKGSGPMFGFDEVADFIHDIETVYDFVRSGKVKITEDLIALTLLAHDQIKKMLQIDGAGQQEDIKKRMKITALFKKVLPGNENEVTKIKIAPPLLPGIEKAEKIMYRIEFKPSPDIFKNTTHLAFLLNEIRGLGECEIISKVDGLLMLEEVDPERCYKGWDIILTTRLPRNSIEDVFIFIDENSEVNINLIGTECDLENDESEKKIGEILVERGDIKAKELQKLILKQDLFGKKLTDAGMVNTAQIQAALAEQDAIKKLKEHRKKVESVSSIRVAANKLDNLVDLVGELVTGQARLTQIANSSDNTSLLGIAEEIERLTADLRDNTMSVRMLTFGTTFSKFKRLLRDLSHDLGKEIVLETMGGETELDKNVIEQLNNPLVHIIRNSADHGVESPDKRTAAGKPRQGTIHLSAAYSGAYVLIKIRDDGAGLNAEVIRKKAIDRGLINRDTKLTEKETFFLIFEPGFSTAGAVTNVSGRGVGMDVVKKAIEALRGSVDIESELGVGTTITLKLPLTLAIIDGLLIMVGNEYFVIPLAAVEECIELTREDIKKAHGRHVANVRGQIVPYIRLREQFHINGTPPEIEQIIITEIENHQIGFVVDHVIGQHQTVIKKLSRVYEKVEDISGATIMADGTVALILDINKHLQYVEKDYLESYC